MSGLFDELSWRGLVHTMSDPELPALLDKGGLVAYIGFDPTADSLHIGNLLQLCNLRRLQEGGHQVIGLVGGATGMIGDPGGRSDERNLLSSDELARNLVGIKAQIERMLLPGALFADNAEWTRGMSVLDFLRDVGKHVTINQMVAKESVRSRIERPEQGISFTEFAYMLLQAMDFLYLFDEYGCRLQMGASDQWGNITMGVDLIRKARGETAYGLVSPLVLRADGAKMGKSVGGTVWLDDQKTSHVDLYQYFLRVEDSVVGSYLRYFTWLARDEIDALDAATKERPEQREAQQALAWEVTKLVHDEAQAEDARERSAKMFGARSSDPTDAAKHAPTSSFPRSPIGLVKALELVALCGSASDARRQIQQGGIYVNEERVTDVDRILDPEGDTLDGQRVLLRRGKKHVHTILFSAT